VNFRIRFRIRKKKAFDPSFHDRGGRGTGSRDYEGPAVVLKKRRCFSGGFKGLSICVLIAQGGKKGTHAKEVFSHSRRGIGEKGWEISDLCLQGKLSLRWSRTGRGVQRGVRPGAALKKGKKRGGSVSGKGRASGSPKGGGKGGTNSCFREGGKGDQEGGRRLLGCLIKERIGGA